MIDFISASSSRGSFSQILNCGVTACFLRSKSTVSPGSVSLAAVTSQCCSSLVRETTRISLPGKLLLEPVVVGAECLVLEVDLHAVGTYQVSISSSLVSENSAPPKSTLPSGSDSTISVLPVAGSNSTSEIRSASLLVSMYTRLSSGEKCSGLQVSKTMQE